MVELDDEALRFFNGLRGQLNIELSEPPQSISERLLNQAAPASARLERVSLDLQVVLDTESYGCRELSEEEWKRVIIRVPMLRLCGETLDVVEHQAPDGVAFTVRDLVAAIEETERQTRGKTEWFGGIDVHHVYFEGIWRGDDGVWSILWGS